MKQGFKILSTIFLMFLISGVVFANSGAYNNDITDSWATGNGAAVVARVNNPSTNWYNPAGLIKLEGIQMSGNIASETMYTEFDSDLTGETITAENAQFLIPALFYTQKINDNIAFGVGINAAYGLVTEWNHPVTNYVATKTSFQPINFNPNIAYKINDTFSAAFGLDIHYATGEMQKKLNETFLNSALNYMLTGSNDILISPDANSTLEGNDIATGWNIAFLYEPNNTVSFGLSYRSEVEFTLDGDVTLEELNGISTLVFGGQTYKIDASLDIAIPATTTFGAAFKLSNSLTLEVDLEYAEWSKIEEFKVKYKGETDLTRLAILNSGNPQEKDWDDTLNFAIGLDYKIDEKKSIFTGSQYRPTPIPEKSYDPAVPSCNMVNLLGGMSFDLDNNSKLVIGGGVYFGLDREVQNTVGNDSLTSINGKYSFEVYVIGASYTKQF